MSKCFTKGEANTWTMIVVPVRYTIFFVQMSSAGRASSWRRGKRDRKSRQFTNTNKQKSRDTYSSGGLTKDRQGLIKEHTINGSNLADRISKSYSSIKASRFLYSMINCAAKGIIERTTRAHSVYTTMFTLRGSKFSH